MTSVWVVGGPERSLVVELPGFQVCFSSWVKLLGRFHPPLLGRFHPYPVRTTVTSHPGEEACERSPIVLMGLQKAHFEEGGTCCVLS